MFGFSWLVKFGFCYYVLFAFSVYVLFGFSELVKFGFCFGVILAQRELSYACNVLVMFGFVGKKFVFAL